MILTVTVNPAVDQTLWVPRLAAGEVNRPRAVQRDPAGKGINCSRMAHRLGWPTVAFGFLAGDVGHLVQRALYEERVQGHFIHIPGQTRINVTVVDEATRAATSLYAPGPEVPRGDLEALQETLDFWLRAGRVLVLGGSLLPGIPSDFYAGLVARARERGVKVIVDCDGEPLRRALDAHPDVIKPNRREAEVLLSRTFPDDAAALDGARELVARGVGAAVISLGARGLICATREQALRVLPPRVELRSTVGSGDSLVAGIAVALAGDQPLEHGLRLGSAAGAATAMNAGTALGTLEQVNALLPQVRVERL